jgi:hypothetical protein
MASQKRMPTAELQVLDRERLVKKSGIFDKRDEL